MVRKYAWLVLAILLTSTTSKAEEMAPYYRFTCMSDISSFSFEAGIDVNLELAQKSGASALAKKYGLWELGKKQQRHKCEFISGYHWSIKNNGGNKFSITINNSKFLDISSPNYLDDGSIKIDYIQGYFDTLKICAVVAPDTHQCKTIGISNAYHPEPSEFAAPGRAIYIPVDLEAMFPRQKDNNSFKADGFQPRP